MDIENDRQSMAIFRALTALNNQVDLCDKNKYEKEALKLIIDKMRIYYIKKIETINNWNSIKLYNLQSNITGFIEDINSALLPNAETFSYIEKINSKLHDSEIDHRVNIQKRLKYTRK